MTLGGPGGDRSAVVTALRAVAGVADAEIIPDPAGGPGTLRLQLAPGADEVLVATTVHRLLGEKFGLGVDAGKVQVVEEAVTRRPRTVPAAPPEGTEDNSEDDSSAGDSGDGDGSEGDGSAGDSGDGDSGDGDSGDGDSGDGGNGDGGEPPVPGVAAWPPPAVLSAVTARVASGPVQVRRSAPQFPRPEAGPAPASGRQSEPAGTLGPVADLDPVEQVGIARGARLLIHRMQLVSASRGVTSEVTLEIAGHEHTGSAGAASTPTSVHRAVALATLRAVERALGGAVRFELEHVETTVLGTDRAVVVEVAMITTHGSERLTGVSSVREDARQAVIRATLDAINRRIETYLVSA
jgi:hypothetical protein